MTAFAQIYGIGLCCPLGKTLEDASKAYAANDHNFVKSEKGPVGADGAKVTLSCVMPFEDVRNFELRLQRLFAGAVDDLVKTLDLSDSAVSMRLVVPRWLARHKIGQDLVTWIVATWPTLFTNVTLLADGDTLAVYELVKGLQEISEGQIPALAIAALDSYMDAELIDMLAISDRIYKRGTPHGLVPGEAAVIVMLGSNATFPATSPIGTIRSAFNGFEAESLSEPQSIIGRGLAKPLRKAFEAFQPDRFLVDLNGERWRSEDLGFALSGALIPDTLLSDFETPLSNTGDCGAANGLVMTAFALSTSEENTEADVSTLDDHEPRRSLLSVLSTSHVEGPRCVIALERSIREN
ncbi:hypothetical protein [Rhizobium oryziradicis]|uniref:Beta-ketoacyl synthase N-terminal domain-containing protein n=1 Tax=Rhizobium oryziradicis TaxID=1867956 RepID=A0A1Q8ZSI2_9HYPH|nr:hypothetical protein [Rhizobium oryziradicis]OLP45039.1 hypothetical protein BJF95_16875 [Rhizobium oryziradicis]